MEKHLTGVRTDSLESHKKSIWGDECSNVNDLLEKGRCFPKYAEVRIKYNKYDKEVFTKNSLVIAVC